MLYAPGGDNLSQEVAVGGTIRRDLGPWACFWHVDYGEWNADSVVSDILTITSVSGSRISGTGNDPTFGTYEVEGLDSQFAVTLSYHGREEQENLVGVVILKKDPVPDILTGAWWQFTRTGEVVGGSVECTRSP